ncbi:MAG: ATP-binding protein, partial [Candidatus Dadabacteria bacterium]|nr:ATP-binding protein [Candidatus Dadabacteria bacterium]
MAENTLKKHEFQAEVKQVLDIVIHSLYTDKEVFIRELVSNASDALEKLRYIQLTGKDIYDENLPLEINIRTDDKDNTITIEDHGVGMTEDELVENLGTIAHSGSKAFLKA